MMAHQEQHQEEIIERGQRLATFERRGSATRPAGELRVCLDEYEGHSYISIRLWEFAFGRLIPTKRGVSVRMGEVQATVEALQRALDEAGGSKPASSPRQTPPARQRPDSHQQGRQRGEWTPPPVARTKYYGNPADRPRQKPTPLLGSRDEEPFDEFAGQ